MIVFFNPHLITKIRRRLGARGVLNEREEEAEENCTS